MRKRTVRNGIRLVIVAFVLIILASFFHAEIADFFSLPVASESRIYRNGMFWAAAIGGYGVVWMALGLVLSPIKYEVKVVRLLPSFLCLTALVFIFFYLLSSSIENPDKEEYRRLRPGETITI